MIDFIYRLNDMIPSWPLGARYSLTQISEATQTSVPHLLQYFSEGLGKELDVAGIIGVEEAVEALNYLSEKMRPEIEERERRAAERRAHALMAFERVMDRVSMMQHQGQWHQAFKTLSYFAGQHQDDLPDDIFVNLCSDAVRSGIKSQANMQELGLWLQKAVVTAMSSRTQEGVEEALDLIDAYGEFFLSEETGKGPLLLGNILAALEEPAARFELWEQFKNLVGQLYPAS